MKILHISKLPLPQKYSSLKRLSFLAWKEKEPKNIYIDRNCHKLEPLRKSKSEAQEHMYFANGSTQCSSPTEKGLR